MALLLNTSVNKQSQAYINIAQVYQAYKRQSNKHKQDINTSERQREQSQIWENCFEVLYVPAFNTMKDFHYKTDPTGSLGAATLTSEFTLELLWTLQSLSCFRKNKPMQAHQLAEAAPLHQAPIRTRNNANSQIRLLKYKIETLVISTL